MVARSRSSRIWGSARRSTSLSIQVRSSCLYSGFSRARSLSLLTSDSHAGGGCSSIRSEPSSGLAFMIWHSAIGGLELVNETSDFGDLPPAVGVDLAVNPVQEFGPAARGQVGELGRAPYVVQPGR